MKWWGYQQWLLFGYYSTCHIHNIENISTKFEDMCLAKGILFVFNILWECEWVWLHAYKSVEVVFQKYILWYFVFETLSWTKKLIKTIGVNLMVLYLWQGFIIEQDLGVFVLCLYNNKLTTYWSITKAIIINGKFDSSIYKVLQLALVLLTNSLSINLYNCLLYLL